MNWSLVRYPMSWQASIIFWWTAFLLIQQTERLFLLPETFAFEPASKELLFQTLWTGFRADGMA
jgi:hypothetical protein